MYCLRPLTDFETFGIQFGMYHYHYNHLNKDNQLLKDIDLRKFLASLNIEQLYFEMNNLISIIKDL
jgi:hypothetical protein